jgi:hypothetical protein
MVAVGAAVDDKHVGRRSRLHWWIHDAVSASKACGNGDEWTMALADWSNIVVAYKQSSHPHPWNLPPLRRFYWAKAECEWSVNESRPCPPLPLPKIGVVTRPGVPYTVSLRPNRHGHQRAGTTLLVTRPNGFVNWSRTWCGCKRLDPNNHVQQAGLGASTVCDHCARSD